MNKFYDSTIECSISTHTDTFEMIFSNDWKISDVISWMKDTYCIDDNNIVEQRVSYVKRFKLKSN